MFNVQSPKSAFDIGLWTLDFGHFLVSHQRPVAIWPAIAEELPRVANFANLVEIEIGDDQRILVARRFGHELSARIAKITLPVKFANVPGLFVTDAIDGADEISVCYRMSWLLYPPQILGKAG